MLQSLYKLFSCSRSGPTVDYVFFQAVQTIHEARIVHSDLKPANFLMVEGQLKLIDFGIAKAISSDTTSIARESQVDHSHCTSISTISLDHLQLVKDQSNKQCLLMMYLQRFASCD